MPRYVATWTDPGTPSAPAIIDAPSTSEACTIAAGIADGWVVGQVEDDFTPPNAAQSAAIGKVALRALIRKPTGRLSLARQRDNVWVASITDVTDPDRPPTRYHVGLGGTVRETSNFD